MALPVLLTPLDESVMHPLQRHLLVLLIPAAGWWWNGLHQFHSFVRGDPDVVEGAVDAGDVLVGDGWGAVGGEGHGGGGGDGDGEEVGVTNDCGDQWQSMTAVL